MATTNGLPTLKIAFEKAAAQVANRKQEGLCGRLCTGCKRPGRPSAQQRRPHPQQPGEDNKKHVELAFEGSDRGAPSLVIPGGRLPPAPRTPLPWRAALKAIEQYSIDYLAGPRRDRRGAHQAGGMGEGPAGHLPHCEAGAPLETAGSDNMGIIEAGRERDEGCGGRGNSICVLRPHGHYPGGCSHGDEAPPMPPTRAHRRNRAHHDRADRGHQRQAHPDPRRPPGQDRPGGELP